MNRFPACMSSTWIVLACLGLADFAFAEDQADAASKAARVNNIQTTDYLVPHISTVPANAGKRVGLFVREKVKSRKSGNAPVVLMVHGTTHSTVPCFDLQFKLPSGAIETALAIGLGPVGQSRAHVILGL